MTRFDLTEAYELLYRLGATENYLGLPYMAFAVTICTEQPERLLSVMKRVYPDVARQYNTTPGAAERNIRTVCTAIWGGNRALLEQLACRPLGKRPGSAQMLAILAHSLRARPIVPQPTAKCNT